MRYLEERFTVSYDTAAVTTHLVALMGDFQIGRKQVHDASIVATLLGYDIHCLLTRNVKDIERFGEIIMVERIDKV